MFLLSILEAEKYFANDEARMCIPTDYAIANGTFVDTNNLNYQLEGKSAGWWLRSLAGGKRNAGFIRNDGAIRYNGYDVGYRHWSVRPALWVDLESGIF